MNDEVIDFISSRWSKSYNNWLDGNCWYFVSILMERFPMLERYYCPVIGHFVAGDGKNFYDWNGKFLPCSNDPPIHWGKLVAVEPEWSARIKRDCMK